MHYAYDPLSLQVCWEWVIYGGTELCLRFGIAQGDNRRRWVNGDLVKTCLRNAGVYLRGYWVNLNVNITLELRKFVGYSTLKLFELLAKQL